MTAWGHLTTIFNQRRVLLMAGLLALCIAFFTTLFFAADAFAVTATSKTINFQGRLLTKTGANVPDGDYNIQFKMYEGGAGTDQDNPGGVLKWTESHLNTQGSTGVTVRNGYFTVSLGSLNPFGASVDWDNDSLWLSMNVAGMETNCSVFGSGSCKADGEMLPMKRITATPYAINAGHLGGRDASGFIQNGTSPQAANLSIQSAATDSVAMTVMGAANQTANLLNIQAEGVETPVVSVSASGSVTIQNAVDTSSALRVNNASGTSILSVDTLKNTVDIGLLTISSGTTEQPSAQIKTNAPLDITSNGMSLDAGSGSLNLQGETIGLVSGGGITIQAGGSASSDMSGANVVISGGAGGESASDGLVVINMPAVKTNTSDSQCLPGGSLASENCTLDKVSVDRSAAVIIGFDSDGKTATMPDPQNTTPGRLFYIVASSNSRDFMLRINSGKGAGIEQSILMKKATTTGLFWSGFNWTVVGGAGTSVNLQNAYGTSSQNAGDASVTLNGTNEGATVSVAEKTETTASNTIIEVQNTDPGLNSGSTKNSPRQSLIADGTFDDASGFNTHWTGEGGASVSRITTDGQEGNSSAKIMANTTAGAGIANKLLSAPAPGAQLRASAYVKLINGPAFNDLSIGYSPDHGLTFVECTNYSTQKVTAKWMQVTCDLTTGETSTTEPYLYIVQASAPSAGRTFLVDTVSVTVLSEASSDIAITTQDADTPKLITLGKSSEAPTSTDTDNLLGSMYYDTTLGKVQCYEADGWGPCSDSPDTFVTLSPQYANAVMNGSDIGVITSDLCSDMLNINDGSSSQPSVCSRDETYNFYKWTSDQTTPQTRSIYVTYKLPGSFKQFAENSTSLMARTDHANSEVTYQIYRDTKEGLKACSAVISASSGNKTAWQKATASDDKDPSECDFAAGDSVLFRINLSASKNANAYVSNLSFIINNK